MFGRTGRLSAVAGHSVVNDNISEACVNTAVPGRSAVYSAVEWNRDRNIYFLGLQKVTTCLCYPEVVVENLGYFHK